MDGAGCWGAECWAWDGDVAAIDSGARWNPTLEAELRDVVSRAGGNATVRPSDVPLR